MEFLLNHLAYTALCCCATILLLVLFGTAQAEPTGDPPALKSPETMPEWTRPIRIPEMIELTHTDPPYAFAGETGSWRLPFKLSKEVPEGAELRLQLFGGRNNRAQFDGIQVENPEAPGYAAATLDTGQILSLQPLKQDGTFALEVPEGGLMKGQTLTVSLGDPTIGNGGVRPDTGHAFNKFFVLYCMPQATPESPRPKANLGHWGKENQDAIVAACTMHILGNDIDRIRAYAPSVVRPGESFPILVRGEDQFCNLSHQNLGSLSVSVGDTPLDATSEPVENATCVRLTVSLPDEGVHRLSVRDARTGQTATTNPIVCSQVAQPVYWGMIHGHTELSDGTGNINYYFRQLKNEVLLDFAGSSDHDHLFETPDEYWRVTQDAVKRWHSPGEFVTILGYEWAKWRKNGDGDRNVYYLGDDRPMYRSDEGHYASPPELFAVLEQEQEKAIVIPHHTAHCGNWCDWKDYSLEYGRLVEIFQMRGSYECAPEDGNPAPEEPADPPPFPTGYVRNALALGWRVGFTAGGDDHRGQWGTEFRFGPGNTGYKQGLMYVEADAKTRAAIFQALYDRRVVATTGARMLLTYRLNGHPIGSELNLPDHPELAQARTLSIDFHGTAPLDRIDIIRNNQVIKSVPGEGKLDAGLSWDDTTPIEDTWLPPAQHCDHPFTFYYVRAIQTDGEIAWASPIWIDP